MSTLLYSLRLEAAVNEWRKFRGDPEYLHNQLCDVCLIKKHQAIRKGLKTVCVDCSQLSELKPLIYANRPPGGTTT